jgi:hypothetical protein
MRKLGFTVVRKGEAVEQEDEKQARVDWSEQEVRLLVADYFAMLEKELLGRSLNKTEHRNALLPQLTAASVGAGEAPQRHVRRQVAGVVRLRP